MSNGRAMNQSLNVNFTCIYTQKDLKYQRLNLEYIRPGHTNFRNSLPVMNLAPSLEFTPLNHDSKTRVGTLCLNVGKESNALDSLDAVYRGSRSTRRTISNILIGENMHY